MKAIDRLWDLYNTIYDTALMHLEDLHDNILYQIEGYEDEDDEEDVHKLVDQIEKFAKTGQREDLDNIEWIFG